MLALRKFYYKLLNSSLKLLVKSKAIPTNPTTELKIDRQGHIFYVLPYHSIADLLAVRQQCLNNNLPDPLEPLRIGERELPRYVFIDKGPRVFSYYTPKQESTKVFHDYLDLLKDDNTTEVQMIPVSVMFGRAPGKESDQHPELRTLNGFQKFFAVLWSGRDCFVRFSNIVSLRYMVENHGTDEKIAHKLARVARIHFTRQRLVAIGPRLPVRQELFNKMLLSKAIEKAIEDEAISKKISFKKAQQNAEDIMEEIAANFTYSTLKKSSRVLGWAWNRLYHGLKVHNAERIRTLAQDGHELVYVPCHRSHMDYLLLSYVLYYQGLVPPHIAAGINLNFWPVGPVFRKLGAFFIRRSFKGSKLYSTIFREYLSELFARGYSVEYFIEGGRSRTGRLLEPKTGVLSMTLQAMLKGNTRPISMIPVYIGYEQVMEVGSYAKELRGAKKERESVWQVMKAIRKLTKLGYGYVNFGEPIPLNSFMNKNEPDWRNDINAIDSSKPTWLNPIVKTLSHDIMVKINNAVAVNAMNLCCTALLNSSERALTRELLLKQIGSYLSLIRNVSYATEISLPEGEPEELLEHALALNRFYIEKDDLGEIIRLHREQAVLMTYYRNNIQHILTVPSLIANIIVNHKTIHRDLITDKVLLIYPFCKKELFMRFDEESCIPYIQTIIDEFVQQNLILEQDNAYSINNQMLGNLQLFAAGVRETLQRYAITLSLLRNTPNLSYPILEQKSRLIAQRLSVLHGINSPEFFDKEVFSTFIGTLTQTHYLNKEHGAIPEKIDILYETLAPLISPQIRMTIESVSDS